ncbi:MAG: dihydroorotate dehydrogenase electron transfer subunit [Ruminococcaceae bacterium]|nr:dihydroorotate dehydrogenase electron transfer subunit [Oscillospiraceae bacterium]
MPYFCDNYPILKREEIAKDIYSYVISCPEAAAVSKAGQFVHIRAEGYTLRRPISICEIDKENGTVRIVFEVRGGGTDRLSQLRVGDKMDIILPLGNGFTVKEIPEGKNVVVVGGGIGVPPMCGVSAQYKNVKAIIGFRSKDKVILEEDLKRIGAEVTVCTDDGSYGESGVVTVPLEKELEKGNTAMIFACGPTPMLKAVIECAKRYNIPCEVSLEQRMACGVGACVGCACNINRDGKNLVLRVCKDGPVFKAEEVVL